ncbi:cell wall-binding repeat-containing protein [Sutcliffiella horikoshii]|uniref:cell wall-binding repeat-containing protein n=1 Tax=Sutcliffiella horikoshii TaxID=79883 RepID=UPI003CEF8DDB
MKKLSLIFAAIILLFNTIAPSIAHGAADVTFPTLESVSVDNAKVATGESVTVSVRATDNEGVSSVYVYYKKPITGVSMQVRLYYNAETDLFEKEIPLDKFYEMGVYKITIISIEDNSGNSVNFYNHQDTEKKLEKGQFEFLGPSEADTTFPAIESISVSQNTITAGDTLTVSLDARDDAGISSAYVYYDKPQTGNSMQLRMEYNPETDRYEKVIPFDSKFEVGLYKVSIISVTDSSGITTNLYDHQDSDGLLETGQFEFVGESNADTTFPVIENIKVNKNKVLNGDSLTVSMKATDLSGIYEAYVYYDAPITGNSIQMRLYYNESTGAWEKSIPVNSGLERGIYNIDIATITDNSGNRTVIYDHQDIENVLGSGQFRYISETNLPEFTSISTNTKEVEAGGDILIDVKVTDDTSLEEATVYYISPQTQKRHPVKLEYNKETKSFQGYQPIAMNTEFGLWKVESLEIIDVNLNKLKVSSNLSAGNFNVIHPVEALDAYIVTSSETWSNKTVNSDVYISPGSVLTVDGNVKINGDIYVIGGLRSFGGLTISGELHASYMTFGYFYPSDGQAIISGTNSISSTIVSSKLLDEVPFTIHDTPIISKGGSVDFTGATLPFVKVTINGQPIDLKENGTFRIKGFDMAGQETLQVKMIDTQGYEHSKSFMVNELYVEEITKDTTTIKGKTQPSVKIVLSEIDQKLVETTSDKDGHFQMAVSGLKENATLTFKVVGLDGILITKKDVVVPDTTPPNKPTVESVYDTSTSVKGTTEATATIVVKAGTKEIGKGTADGTGKYSVTISKQKAGTELSVTATDQAGNRGEATVVKVADKTAPAKPVVNEVSDQSTTVTGTTEATATVVVKAGTKEIGKGTADGTGKYSVTIAKQKAGLDLTVLAKDQAGNQSEPTIVKVTDKTAPNWPSDEKLEISNIKDKSLLLKWPNATDNDVVSYIIYENGKEIKKSPADQTKLEITNLVYEKEYKFAVMAVDTSGNKSVLLESKQIIIKDELPPIWPKDSKIKVSNKKASSFSIGWTLADDAEKYNCYLNKELVQTVESTMTCNFTGLIPGSEYHVKVEAIDKYGNESTDGPGMTIKTEGISRLSGPTRYDTSAAISTTGWKQAETVIIARGDSFPDALAGAPLAYKLNAPILLTNKDKLSSSTSAEIKRLGAKKVIILGGTGAVTTAVEKELKGMKLTVERISGSTRYETANAIAKRVGNNKQVVLAYGKNFPDALAIASYAAEKGYPILLTDKDKIAESTKKLVKEYGSSKVIVVGGESVISQKVVQSLSMKNVERIGGKNRYETAANIITRLNLKTDKAFIANGTGFADALTGSVLAAKHQAPLLLVKKTELPKETKTLIQIHNIKNFTILGGTEAIGEGVLK